MAGFAARAVRTLPLPMPGLRTLGLHASLARAERSVDARFTRAASLRLDRALIGYEAAGEHRPVLGWRRAA